MRHALISDSIACRKKNDVQRASDLQPIHTAGMHVRSTDIHALTQNKDTKNASDREGRASTNANKCDARASNAKRHSNMHADKTSTHTKGGWIATR